MILRKVVALYTTAPVEELMFVANKLRQLHNPGKIVGWMIDRNVNITNICFSQCVFCNFCRTKGSQDAYITTLDDYKSKIDELYSLGGDQLLLQGGMNPGLDLKFYIDLFRNSEKAISFAKAACTGTSGDCFPGKKRKDILY